MPTRPCHRCGSPVPVGHTYRLEHLPMIGWRVLEEVSFVEWCGHAQNFLVVPHVDGEAGRAGADSGGGGVSNFGRFLEQNRLDRASSAHPARPKRTREGFQVVGELVIALAVLVSLAVAIGCSSKPAEFLA